MNETMKRQVPVFVSVLTYFAMLFATMLLMMGPKGISDLNTWRVGIYFAPFFPFGLGFLCAPGSPAGLVFVFISYVSFVAVLLAFIRVRTWATYSMVCFGFAILLLLNVAGCREAGKGLSNITMLPNTTEPIPTKGIGTFSGQTTALADSTVV